VTAEIVVAIGLIAIIAAILLTGLVLAFRAGKDADTKKEAKDATRKLERHLDPLPTDADYLSRLRRAQERLARLRDRAAKP
jgi:flagellar biosynthesis/type III secretory pathway M-ring protein FliF/YscJ